jgi:alkylation response protein AidB-like acyl-CoA dehydrogenase
MNESTEMSDAIDMIRKSAEGLADRRDLSRIRALRYTTLGFDPETWRSMCDLGWTGIRVKEEHGGVGLSMAAYCALAQELGAALVPEPVIGGVLSAALLIAPALSTHLSGESLVLPAWQDSRDAVKPSGALEVKQNRLFGRKYYVQLASGADAFLAIGPQCSWLVSATDSATHIEVLETQDGGHVATVIFDGAIGQRIEIDAAPAFAEACLATSAYLLGLMEAALERTLEYLAMRIQFGKPLASFQVLQHRCVDLKLQLELTRASVEDAAVRWDRHGRTTDSYAAISRAKVRATSAAMIVARQSIQLHGGIGFTDEHDIGLYLRKAMMVAPQFGTATLHRGLFAAGSPVGESKA